MKIKDLVIPNKRNKYVIYGIIILAILIYIGGSSFGDFLYEMRVRIFGDGIIDFEKFKSFCGFTSRYPGESLSDYRLRSAKSAFSAQIAMSLILTVVFGIFFMIVKFIFWVSGDRKK